VVLRSASDLLLSLHKVVSTGSVGVQLHLLAASLSISVLTLDISFFLALLLSIKTARAWLGKPVLCMALKIGLMLHSVMMPAVSLKAGPCLHKVQL
jgi:hypothetical protein